jgi:hypothetical protein
MRSTSGRASREDAGEHEDAISRKAISGDAEIWTERFASRLRDPGEPISRSKAGFERFRAIEQGFVR